MARYSTEIVSTWEQEEVFEYLSTFSNAREWDPGVTEGESMSPGPADVGSGYRLAVRIAGRIVQFDYRVVDIDRPRRVVLQARARRDRLDGHHHGGVCGSRLPGPLRGSARGTGRAAPGGAPHRPGLRPHGRPGVRRVAPGAGVTPARLARAVDIALEASVVGSFSRAGFLAAAASSNGGRRPTSRAVSSSSRAPRRGSAGRLHSSWRASAPRCGSSAGTRGGPRRPPGLPAPDGAGVEAAVLDIVDDEAVDAFAALVAARARAHPRARPRGGCALPELSQTRPTVAS